MNIQFGIAYLDTEVTETIDDVRGFPLLTPLPVGASLSLSPEWSYNAIGRYMVPLADGYALEAQVDYSYRDSIAGILSDANAIVDTRENLGARVTLSSGDQVEPLGVGPQSHQREFGGAGVQRLLRGAGADPAVAENIRGGGDVPPVLRRSPVPAP